MCIGPCTIRWSVCFNFTRVSSSPLLILSTIHFRLHSHFPMPPLPSCLLYLHLGWTVQDLPGINTCPLCLRRQISRYYGTALAKTIGRPWYGSGAQWPRENVLRVHFMRLKAVANSYRWVWPLVEMSSSICADVLNASEWSASSVLHFTTLAFGRVLPCIYPNSCVPSLPAVNSRYWSSCFET